MKVPHFGSPPQFDEALINNLAARFAEDSEKQISPAGGKSDSNERQSGSSKFEADEENKLPNRPLTSRPLMPVYSQLQLQKEQVKAKFTESERQRVFERVARLDDSNELL